MTPAPPFCSLADAWRDVDSDPESLAPEDLDPEDLDPEAFDPEAFEPEAFDRAVGLELAAGFARDDAFAERLDVLFVLGAEPLEDPRLDLLRGLLEAGLLEAGLLLAILIPLLGRERALDGATRSGQG